MLSEAAKQRAQARVGQTLGSKYRLDRLLAVAGMAAVYEATHRNGGRAAIKMMHPELSHITEVRTRFLREGYLANRVGHPAVVRVLDDDVDAEGCAYIVMELLEGETLEARWANNGERLPLAEVALHVDRILEVLGTAHDNGIVHRDMKPENVFLTRAGELKVMDFGIARLLDRSGITRTGDQMGTPAFMPPEQAEGRNRDVDGRSDVWSVGAMTFTLLTGRSVHEARTAQEQMIYAATQRARPIHSVMPELHDDVAQIVDVALAWDKSERWQTASAMRNALRNAMAHVSPERDAKIAPVAPPPPETGAPARASKDTVRIGSMMARDGFTQWVPKGEGEKGE